MSGAEDKAAAQGAFVVAAVARQDLKDALREKDAAIERLEREVELLQARVEELSPSIEEAA